MHSISSSPQIRGAVFGLSAAVLFGISPPFAKLLLPEAGPLLIAGLLYFGAGLGLVTFGLFSGTQRYTTEARIRASDIWLLTGIILAGGILAPVCMLVGLQHLSGVLGSLLLNLEAPFTLLLAILVFGEHLGPREILGSALIFAGAGVLAYEFGEMRIDWIGIIALVAACLLWAVDNNLSQRLSLRDPVAITRIKTLAAGVCVLALALTTGHTLPRTSILLPALLLGMVSYGVSLVLDMQALRLLGAAREAGYFAIAPFIGAAVAVPVLGERWGSREFVAAGLMAIGLVVLLREHHSHGHAHQEIEHEHAHMHSDHHDHAHDMEHVQIEPHAHPHRHLPLVHDHPHVSEAHHRHEHT
jgi:drug/metabolite transporter (DMT)-like permease